MSDREIEQLAVISYQLADIASHMQRMDIMLCGDEDTPGLVTRVDRLEQRAERSTWHLQAAIGASIGAVVSWAAGHMLHQ